MPQPEYVYVTNVAGANGQYVYVVPAMGGTVNVATGQQVFPVNK